MIEASAQMCLGEDGQYRLVSMSFESPRPVAPTHLVEIEVEGRTLRYAESVDFPVDVGTMNRVCGLVAMHSSFGPFHRMWRPVPDTEAPVDFEWGPYECAADAHAAGAADWHPLET